MIYLKPWSAHLTAFNEKAFMRVASFKDGRLNNEEHIVIMERGNSWCIERPFRRDFLLLEGSGNLTPESLMFKVDLYLTDIKRYKIEDLFIFPDNDF